MSQVIKLNYRSVFKYENETESFKYHGIASLDKKDNQTIISYQDQNKIKIVLKENEVILHNDASILRLHQHHPVMNHYQTAYGALKLEIRLISYECGDTIKIKYGLYDGIHLLSQVYILLQYQILEN